MKVLFITPWYPHSSDPMLGLFVYRHAVSAAQHFAVSVIFAFENANIPAGNKYFIETTTEEGVFEIRIGYKPSGIIGLPGRIINLTRWVQAVLKGWNLLIAQNKRPDLIHANVFTKSPFMACLLSYKHRIPFIVTEHWSKRLNPPKSTAEKLENFLIHRIAKKAKNISCVSSLLGDAMKQQGLCKSYELLPNVIDCDLFHIDTSVKTGSKKNIVHISCFEEKSKNLSGILRAVKSLSEQRQDFTFTMIGTGPDFEYCTNLAKELNILDTYVQFAGLLEGKALAEALAKADFSVLYSHYETFGIVVYESLACGVPVLVSDVADYAEHISQDLGLLIKKGDSGLLSKAMNRMLDTCHTYDKQKLRNYVLDHFSKEKTGQILSSLYGTY